MNCPNLPKPDFHLLWRRLHYLSLEPLLPAPHPQTPTNLLRNLAASLRAMNIKIRPGIGGAGSALKTQAVNKREP